MQTIIHLLIATAPYIILALLVCFLVRIAWRLTKPLRVRWEVAMQKKEDERFRLSVRRVLLAQGVDRNSEDHWDVPLTIVNLGIMAARRAVSSGENQKGALEELRRVLASYFDGNVGPRMIIADQVVSEMEKEGLIDFGPCDCGCGRWSHPHG